MGGSIVCGIDGSADSQAAVKVAAQFADRLEARSSWPTSPSSPMSHTPRRIRLAGQRA